MCLKLLDHIKVQWRTQNMCILGQDLVQFYFCEFQVIKKILIFSSKINTLINVNMIKMLNINK